MRSYDYPSIAVVSNSVKITSSVAGGVGLDSPLVCTTIYVRAAASLYHISA